MTELRPIRPAPHVGHPMRRVRNTPVVTRRAFEDFSPAPIEPMPASRAPRPWIDRLLIVTIIACSTWIMLSLAARGIAFLWRAAS